MKVKFSQFYRPSKEEFQKMWEKGLFVFDTSVLLNLYEYSIDTRNNILEIINILLSRAKAYFLFFLSVFFIRNGAAIILDIPRVNPDNMAITKRASKGNSCVISIVPILYNTALTTRRYFVFIFDTNKGATKEFISIPRVKAPRIIPMRDFG